MRVRFEISEPLLTTYIDGSASKDVDPTVMMRFLFQVLVDWTRLPLCLKFKLMGGCQIEILDWGGLDSGLWDLDSGPNEIGLCLARLDLQQI